MNSLTATDYGHVVLKPKEDGRLRNGHLWVFSNEIAQAPEGIEPGVLTDVVASTGGFLGRGFYHPHSLIAFRLVSTQKEDIDAAFFEKRLSEAIAYRSLHYPGATAYRLVFGESDRLPGLIVDRYGDYLVIQILSAGMERFKRIIVEQLIGLMHPRGIVWRADAPVRALEGLREESPAVLSGEVSAPVEITLENGTFLVDLLRGQKTGFYFDQRENRQALAAFCSGKRVLDAFCYSGGFGIAAARAGARDVVMVDSSHAALDLASANAERNDVAGRCSFVEGDVLDLLAHKNPEGSFDVISIDPPAYARSKKHLPMALKAYEKLNALALRALPRGGILASSSCSHFVTHDLFLTMLRRSAAKAQRNVRLLELRSQAKDHPVLLAMPETEYLKCALLEVL